MDIRQGELGLLLALDVLLQEESVSLAAKRLGISQPAMSAQLRRLRVLFNDPLLTSSGRRLVATSKALAIRGQLRHNLTELDTLVRTNRTFEPAKTTRAFRVIGTDYVQSILAAELDRIIAHKAPGARLAFLSFEPQTLWRSLEEDKTDLALVTGMNLQEAKAQIMFEEKFQVIQRKNHPRGTGELTLDEFCEGRHILVSPEGGGFVGATDKLLSSMGRKRKVSVSIPNFLLAPALVSQSDEYCLLPTRLAARYSETIDAFETPFASPKFNVEMLWHPRRQNDPAHIWFREEVRMLMRRL